MKRFVVVRKASTDITDVEVFFALNKDFKFDELDSEYFGLFNNV